jgi:hypothetical protein
MDLVTGLVVLCFLFGRVRVQVSVRIPAILGGVEVVLDVTPCSAVSGSMKLYRSTLCNIPEGITLHIHSCENLESNPCNLSGEAAVHADYWDKIRVACNLHGKVKKEYTIFVGTSHCKRIQNSSVGIATDYELDDRGVGV